MSSNFCTKSYYRDLLVNRRPVPRSSSHNRRLCAPWPRLKALSACEREETWIVQPTYMNKKKTPSNASLVHMWNIWRLNCTITLIATVARGVTRAQTSHHYNRLWFPQQFVYWNEYGPWFSIIAIGQVSYCTAAGASAAYNSAYIESYSYVHEYLK